MEILLGILGGVLALGGLLFAAFSGGQKRAAAKAQAELDAARALAERERARRERDLADQRAALEDRAAKDKAAIRAETERRVAAPVTTEEADRIHDEIQKELEKP